MKKTVLQLFDFLGSAVFFPNVARLQYQDKFWFLPELLCRVFLKLFIWRLYHQVNRCVGCWSFWVTMCCDSTMWETGEHRHNNSSLFLGFRTLSLNFFCNFFCCWRLTIFWCLLSQYCESRSGIQCLFDTCIRDTGSGRKIPDTGSEIWDPDNYNNFLG